MASFSLIVLISVSFTVFLSVSAEDARVSTADLSSSGQAMKHRKNFTYVCDPERYKHLGLNVLKFSFCDSSLSYSTRAKDLVRRMTLAEKVRQLGNKAYGVPRLGLPKYEWWSEALHGVSKIGPGTFFDTVVPGATSFPTVVLLAATFNESLWKNIGQVVSTEARAMYNLGRAGLTFWSPNINVVRDPRWGRALETPGEDPFVAGRYAVNYVRGLQDVEGAESVSNPDERPLKVSACCKHYAAYDVDNWLGVDRFHFDARVTEQDMLETFLKPFEMCVRDGDVSSVMCSYNRVNGIPTCADSKILKDTIRGEWNLHGYIVSDCDSIQVMVDNHKYLQDTKEDAVARTLKAGLDLDCGEFYPNFTANAVEQGKVQVKDIDTSLEYLYIVLMRLGYFDGNRAYDKLGKDNICTDENIELAAQAAREGIVLLKNNKTLPLSTNKIRKIAVVGPHANATFPMIGNYAGIPCRYVTAIEGFSKYAKVIYRIGCDVTCKNESLIWPAVRAAKEADATIIVAGLDLSVEAEGLDREDLLLPGYQTKLIQQIAETSRGPVILVIMSGGGVDISFAENNPKIKAILWASYPGQEGGRAIADVIFGKYNPGGRLPLTWYQANYVDMLPMTSMSLRPVIDTGFPGRTYKFYNGSVVYPFGHGLSYTRFKYMLTHAKPSIDIKLDKFQHCQSLRYDEASYVPPCPAILIDDLKCDQDLEFEVEVMNVGKMDGTKVVLVYSQPPSGVARTHIKQVIGFKKVFVKAGDKSKVNFRINACAALGLVDYRGYKLLPSGSHTILIGDRGMSFPIVINYDQ
ncbi:hypothetical protein CDL15_Pgr001162 [Punica granatum]|uniref:Fibronectin type III-like domain-containing protein n=1 Tax=Punica granatum TaxID=22663 RepID=A0A218WKL7_PUNGR|nr:hypothetical protein CDL15_Pgr001162 [Punica granatum]